MAERKPKAMNIGFFTDTYTPEINGVVTSIVAFRNDLLAAGNRVPVFAPKSPGSSRDDHDVYRFPSLPSVIYKGWREPFPFSPKILNAIPKMNLDILHLQTPGQIGLLGLHLGVRYNLPVIFTYHTHYPEYFSIYKRATPLLILGLIAYPLIIRNPAAYGDLIKATSSVELSSTWSRQLAEKLSAVLCNQTDGIIAPSFKIKKLLIKWGVKKPIRVIPTGIHLDEFEGVKETFRAKHGIRRSTKLVIYLGRLGAEKNIDQLLEAYKLVRKLSQDSKLVIAGDGPYRSSLQARAKKLGLTGHVIFPGFLRRPEALGLMRSADLFVFPSLTDTQGLVVLEAAASGLPVVMIDREVTTALVNNRNGFYAKNNPADLAAKILKVIDHPERAAAFGEASKQLVRSYGSDKMERKLLSFYEKVISAKKRSRG